MDNKKKMNEKVKLHTNFTGKKKQNKNCNNPITFQSELILKKDC